MEAFLLMDKRKKKLILVVSFISALLLCCYFKFYYIDCVKKFNLRYTPYFFDLDDYLYFIAGLWIIAIISLFVPRLDRLGQIVSAILLGATGYAFLEMIYPNFRVEIPPAPTLLPPGKHYYDIITGDLNYYLIHRTYQYVPLIFIVLVLFRSREERQESFLQPGNWKIETGFLDKKNPCPWSRVVLRISCIAVILAIAALVLRLKLAHGSFTALFWGPLPHGSMLMRPVIDQIVLLPSNILGAANNCFIEEFLFRGVLLTVFSRAIGQKWGNLLQALLFGMIHFPSFSLIHYLEKVVVFTFIGWLFGKATIETGGIKSSWVIHTMIVVSMYLAQTV